MDLLEDFLSFPSMCGKPSYDHVFPRKHGIQSDPAFCQLLPGCT